MGIAVIALTFPGSSPQGGYYPRSLLLPKVMAGFFSAQSHCGNKGRGDENGGIRLFSSSFIIRGSSLLTGFVLH
jgi:hypothetical protein